MIQDSAEITERRLGFPLPPTRPAFETFRTDYRIGLCGLAWVVQIMHLPAYRAARFRVTAGCEIDPKRIEEVQGSAHPLPRIHSDYREMIASEDVDVVDCCFGHEPARAEARLDVIRAAGEAGKPLMIHKPMATNLDQARAMLAEADAAGIPLAVNQDCRYNPATYSVKGLLSPERLGTPVSIELASYWQGRPPSPDDRRPAWIAHVIHHADLIRWWVDSPCRSVYARSRGLISLITYEFENGTIAHHVENHSGVKAHQVTMNLAWERGVIRAGHNWNWHLASAHDYDFVTVWPGSGDGPGIALPLPEHVYEPPWSLMNKWLPHEGPYYDLGAPIAGMMGTMGLLMKALDEGTPPDNSAASAFESLRKCIAAERSAAEGVPIDPTTL